MAKKRQQGAVLVLEGRAMAMKNGKVTAQPIMRTINGVEKNLSLVSMGENRVFRAFNNPDKVIVDGVTGNVRADWTDFAVVDLSNQKGLQPLLPEFLLDEGFWIGDKQYKCVLRSASGMRQVKYVFTAHQELWESVDSITYGAKFGDIVEMSKVRTREGLALTTSMAVKSEFTHSVIDDFSRTINVEASQYLSGAMQNFEGEIEITPTDGMGFVTYDLAKVWAKQLGLSYVPTAFQVRFAGAKGLLIVWKWDRTVKGHDHDVLFLDSMWKFNFDTKKYSPDMEIAQWSKPLKSEYFNLCYQYIQALDINPEDLIAIADESLSMVENGIMKDASKAMKFLGMVDNIGDGEYEEGLTSKLTQALDANPAVISDFYVQKKLRGLVEKFVMDMRKGRVPVKGAYRYVCADPTVIFGNENGVLQAGENYYNGYVGTMAGFRSPLIDSSEVTALDFVSVPEWENMKEHDAEFGEFTYLEGLIVLNTYDDTDPRMGGMDKDGDKIAVTDDVRIVNSVKGGRLVYDAESYDTVKVPNTKEEKYKFDLATMKSSRIGIMTDYATIWTDFMIHKKKPQVKENIEILRILQGQEIDSVKTGYTPEMPEALEVKFAPHWMEKNAGKDPEKYILEYKTTSPLGKLYDHIGCPFCSNVSGAKPCSHVDHGAPKEIQEKQKKANQGWWFNFNNMNPDQFEKHNLTFLRNIDKEEATQIFDYVRNLKRHYGQEMMAITQLEEKSPKTDEYYNMYQGMRSEVFERYTEAMRAINADPRTVSAVAYQISYVTDSNRQGSGISFPWITAFDGLKLILADSSDSRYKLMPVFGKEVKAGTFTFYKGEVVVDGEAIMEANVEGGDHEVIELDGKFFVKAPQRATVIVEQAPKQAMVAFSIKGFKHHGFTATTAMELLKENNGMAYLVDQGKYIGVLVNDTQIGVVGAEDDYTIATVMNKEIRINTEKHTPLTFVSQRDNKVYSSGQVGVTAVVTDELEMIESEIESEEVDLKDDFDAKFKSFGFAGTPVVQFDLESNTGKLVCDFGGNEVIIPVEVDAMEDIYFKKAIKNQEIAQAMVRLVARKMTELRSA